MNYDNHQVLSSHKIMTSSNNRKRIIKHVDNIGIQLLRVNEDMEKESEKMNHANAMK